MGLLKNLHTVTCSLSLSETEVFVEICHQPMGMTNKMQGDFADSSVKYSFTNEPFVPGMPQNFQLNIMGFGKKTTPGKPGSPNRPDKPGGECSP